MPMIFKNKKIFVASILFSLAFCAFAEVTVINPAPGSYANLQSLVIESNQGEEIYYSFSGSDPLAQGFAYDGPVVLDVTGNVELRIAVVDNSQNKSEIKVNYSVQASQSENPEINEFLKGLQEKGPLVEYTAGDKILIPWTMGYSFVDGEKFEKGKEISISKKSTMERFLPVNLSDGNSLWRFVLKILPSEPGALSRLDVPFKIEGWSKIFFIDPKRIYSLDGKWWQSASKTLFLDRNVENSLYFQSVEYSAENPINKIDLPPKPSVEAVRQSDGSVVVRLSKDSAKGNKFSLGASSIAKTKLIGPGLYPELVIDTFAGDKIEGQIPVDVFYEQVYQGTLFVDVSLNRLTPNIPVIKSSASSSYARDDVIVSASCGPKLKLYCSVSNPIQLEPSFSPTPLASLKYEQGEYNLYKGQNISLFGDTEKILAYKVSFYSEDEAGVKSATAEYSVVIDKYNYYVDPASQSPSEEGTPFAPYKDLTSLAKIVQSKQFSRFYIRGTVQLPAGEISLPNNLEFSGEGDARILLPSNSVFVLKNAGLYAQKVIFEKSANSLPAKKMRAAAKALTNFFILDHSAATLKNCEVIGLFAGDGTVFSSSSSSLSLESTGITSNAEGYSCALNSSGPSKINVTNSRVLSVADTAVAFSSTGGSLFLDNNFVQVTGRLGRPAEFIDCEVSITKNKFTADVKNKADGYKEIYVSGSTQFVIDKGNTYK